MAELEGKRALVTGGAQGLGRAIATLFVERGAKVMIAEAEIKKADGEMLAKFKPRQDEIDQLNKDIAALAAQPVAVDHHLERHR